MTNFMFYRRFRVYIVEKHEKPKLPFWTQNCFKFAVRFTPYVKEAVSQPPSLRIPWFNQQMDFTEAPHHALTQAFGVNHSAAVSKRCEIRDFARKEFRFGKCFFRITILRK